MWTCLPLGKFLNFPIKGKKTESPWSLTLFDSLLIWEMGVKGMGRVRQYLAPVPFVLAPKATQNYISQAPLPSGFLTGSANGRHWVQTKGREEEAVRILLTPPTYPALATATATPWLIPLGRHGTWAVVIQAPFLSLSPGGSSDFLLSVIPICLLCSYITYELNSLH